LSDLAAAAAAMGVPETLVQRSAEAKAQETGSTVDEILAAWAGGGSAPVTEDVGAPKPTAETTAPAENETTEEPSPPEVVIEVPAAVAAAPPSAPAVSGEPPVLVGTSDNPLSVMIAAIGLFVLVFFLGLVGPSLQVDTPGARSSQINLSPAGENGLSLYSSLGCAACHTQMVRPVVADVGLGVVTINDANQPLGTRRFGPDLSDVGARLSGNQMEALIGGSGDHPVLGLSTEDMAALVTYLLESNTSGGG